MSTSNSATPGTQRRWAARPSAAPLAKIGMVLFALGLIAIVADLVLFVSGQRNLPLWLNLLCMLAPLGLGVGLVSVVQEARATSRGTARPAAPQQSAPTESGD